VLGQTDVIVDLLVRREPADEHDVGQPILEERLERRQTRRATKAIQVEQQRQDAGGRETERLELAPVEV
jgi:hypothetical protein